MRTAVDEVEELLTARAAEPACLAEEWRRAAAELDELDRACQRLRQALASQPVLETDAEVRAFGERLAERRTTAQVMWTRALLACRAAGAQIELTWPEPAAEPMPPPPPEPTKSVEPAAPPSPPVQIDPHDLVQLQAALNGARPAAPHPTVITFSSHQWLQLAAELGEVPPAVAGETEVRSELKRLLAATRTDRVLAWRNLPAEAQTLLIGHIAARARCLQGPPASEMLAWLDPDRDLDQLFSTLSHYLKLHQPGFVHGLGRHHEPHGDSWRADAKDLWHRLRELAHEHQEAEAPNRERAIDQLTRVLREAAPDEVLIAQLQTTLDAGVAQDDARVVRLLGGHLELLKKHARFKTLRRAIREQAAAAAVAAAGEETVETTTGPGADWRYWPLVRGRRAAMLGGDPREEARQRIQQRFELDELDWDSLDQTRHIDSLAARIRAGGVDLVIVLQSFVSHKATDKVVDACRDASVPFICVERGYGVERIRMAIEHDLGALLATLDGHADSDVRPRANP